MSVNPLLASLEDIAVLGFEGNTELQKLDKGIGELFEEDLAVLGVAVNVLLEFLVLDKGQIAGQHHQGLGLAVSVLGGTVPLPPSPLLVNQEAEELVGENGRAEVPRTVVAGAIGVGTAQRVSAAKSDHFAVIEAHAAEDGADVVLALGSIGETSVGSAGGNVTVLATGSPGNGRSLHFLDGADTGKGPEIAVADPGEFLYITSAMIQIMPPTSTRKLTVDGFEEVTGKLQPSIGAVVRLGSESHGSSVAATGAGLLVVGAASVPCQSNEDLNESQQTLKTQRYGEIAYRSVATIIVVILLNQKTSDLVVNLLVIFLGRHERTGGLCRNITAAVEVVCSTTGNDTTETPEQTAVGLASISFGGVATAASRTEGLGRDGEARAASNGAEIGTGDGPGEGPSSGGHCEVSHFVY
ncbi:hypothetical protein EIK77_010366 [Talaromyces pinophilus]|nr:hypothetical protein EIK77_010366 [Talaromyces pinophilus]